MERWLGTNASVSITNPGTYTVTASNTNGCTSSESITITEDVSIPVVSLTNNTGSNTLNCLVNAISYTASGGVDYLWSGGNNTTSANNQFTAVELIR
jgi:hypothetical protein